MRFVGEEPRTRHIVEARDPYEERGQQHHPHTRACPPDRRKRTRCDPAPERPARRGRPAREPRKQHCNDRRERVHRVFMDQRDRAGGERFERQRDSPRHCGKDQRFTRGAVSLDRRRRFEVRRLVRAIKQQRRCGNQKVDGDCCAQRTSDSHVRTGGAVRSSESTANADTPVLISRMANARSGRRRRGANRPRR